MFGKKIKTDDQKNKESNHQQVPGLPGLKKRRSFFR
jgi:hypothetical protein